tara:strand:- start:2 stop:253 length:252 start_codon:yes stop_codon:yes gene_type:complete
MPRRRKKPLPIPEMRRKCNATGKVKKVTHRYIELPYNMNRAKKTDDYEKIPGAVVYNYSSHEAAESVHGSGSFTHQIDYDEWD